MAVNVVRLLKWRGEVILTLSGSGVGVGVGLGVALGSRGDPMAPMVSERSAVVRHNTLKVIVFFIQLVPMQKIVEWQKAALLRGPLL